MPSKAGKFWLLFAISTLLFAISTLALIVSVYALYVTTEARKDARAVAGLDLLPVLALDSQLRWVKDIPPHYTVTNNGPVEVVLLEIQPISHRYAGVDDGLTLSSYTGEMRQTVMSLEPFAHVSFQLPDWWLAEAARKIKNLKHHAIELRLIYRRPPDMRKFVVSTFYFMNPGGDWVNETDSSLDPETYDPIKEAVFKAASQPMTSFQSGDRLHPRRMN